MFFAQFASNDLITASRATIAGKIGQVPMVGQGVNSYFFEQHPPYGWSLRLTAINRFTHSSVQYRESECHDLTPESGQCHGFSSKSRRAYRLRLRSARGTSTTTTAENSKRIYDENVYQFRRLRK
jgi:hypothetical protein